METFIIVIVGLFSVYMLYLFMDNLLDNGNGRELRENRKRDNPSDDGLYSDSSCYVYSIPPDTAAANQDSNNSIGGDCSSDSGDCGGGDCS